MSDTVRVLHILHSMNRGGAETMLMNYYRNMDRTKVQFDFLLTFEGKSDYEDEIYALGGKVFHVTPLTAKTIVAYCRDIKQFLKEHPEYAIVHSHTSSKSALPLWIAKKCGVPVRISHSHNMFIGASIFSPKECMRKILRAPLKKVSTHNFSCSKDAGIWLYGEKYWKEGKVSVLKNAIDIKNFCFSEETRKKYRQELGIDDQLLIGHVGRFQTQKNHDFLVDIFYEISKKDSSAKLLLVGEGPLQEKIKDKVAGLGITDCVIFAGVRDDVANLMQAMDVFLFPSLFEGLGIVLVEAQAAGLPCVASKTVIPEEVRLTEEFEFIDLEESAQVWAERVLGIKGTENRLNGQDKVLKAGYDIKTSAKELETFYLTCGK